MEGRETPSVAIIITLRDYARFLGDAIESAVTQTRQADEILVVDDGSEDQPAAILESFPQVKVIKGSGEGISQARNAGLAMTRCAYVIFLDADDVLHATAVRSGLACHSANPGAAFVYGGYRLVDGALNLIGGPYIARAGPQGYRDLLRGNIVRMHAAVMYDRQALDDAGGFDPATERCEDYDMYLRLAAHGRFASHTDVVADYRRHGENMSSDKASMYRWHRTVIDRHRPRPDAVDDLVAWEEGQRALRRSFADSVWKRDGGRSGRQWQQRGEMVRILPRASLWSALRQTAARFLPRPLADQLRRVRHKASAPAFGRIDFGDLARLKPISADYGYIRGTPVDRYYIEQFLDRHRADIRGTALELASDVYCRQFGSGIGHQDILNLEDGVPNSTICGDLADRTTLAPGHYDVIVCTQALQLIYEQRLAVANIHDALKPGGVALVTAPGLSPVEPGATIETWYRLLTVRSALRMFGDAFGPDNVEVEGWGNVFAAICFLEGIAHEEIGPRWLDPRDAAYPVVVTIRAQKPAD